MMNPEQRVVFDKVRRKLTSDQGGGLLEYVAGSAGVGKSFLINCIDYLVKTFHPAKERAIIKAAPTGVASRNIQGVTLHKAFSLGVEQHSIAQYMKLGGRTLHEKRLLFRDVRWILIDEVSMISYQVLRMISLRLSEIFDNDLPFGGLNVILFGDLLQLKPVRGNWIFDQPKYLSHEVNLWYLFNFNELQTVMRQRERDAFFNILQKMRIGTLVKEDVETLGTRKIDMSEPENGMLVQSLESLHLYPKVRQVDGYNAERIDQMGSLGHRVYNIKAQDRYGSGTRCGQPAPEDLLYTDIRKCAGIPQILSLSVGCKIMLKWNIDPIGGLCNGSIGVVRHFEWTGLRRQQMEDGDLPEYILVEFEQGVSPNHYCRREGFETCVAVKPKTFEFVGRRCIKIHRYQLPVTLSFAVSIHKSQGLSLDTCTVDLGKDLFTYGLAYVATSRVRTFDGLLLTEIDSNKLIVNKRGIGPCNPVPLKELYRLKIIQFLGILDEDLDTEFIDELVNWTTEYVMCKACKIWKCICEC